MEVIGVGLPKTGTLSLCEALNILGYNCHHGGHVHGDVDKMRFWVNFRGDNDQAAKELESYFSKGSYSACSDLPTCAYYKELLLFYPNAKFILTTRDADSWFQSRFSMLVWEAERVERFFFRLLSLFHPRYKLYAPLLDKLESFVYGRTVTSWLSQRLLGDGLTKDAHYREHYIQCFYEHNKSVIEHIPERQLLTFTVKDGWEPLCKFLGVSVPDVPFPHANEGLSTLEKVVFYTQLRDFLTSPHPWIFAFSMALFVKLSLPYIYCLRKN